MVARLGERSTIVVVESKVSFFPGTIAVRFYKVESILPVPLPNVITGVSAVTVITGIDALTKLEVLTATFCPYDAVGTDVTLPVTVLTIL